MVSLLIYSHLVITYLLVLSLKILVYTNSNMRMRLLSILLGYTSAL